VDQEKAADALGILRSGEERVRQRTRRQKALTLGVTGGLTLLGFARKDIRHPVVRRVAAGVVLGVSRSAFAWFGMNERLVGRVRVDSVGSVEREV
jgi:hypothetical protein